MDFSIKTMPNGEKYLDIPEMRTLSDAEMNFKSKGDEDSKNDFLAAFHAFLDMCIAYCTDVFKDATYENEKLAYDVFIFEANSENQYKSYLRSTLYIAKLYAQKWKELINVNNIANCNSLTNSLLADFDWLFTEYENHFKNHDVQPSSWSRRILCSRDMLWMMGFLTFMEQWTDMSKISFRDIRPYSIFMVRQCLEISGKSLIGYYNIEDDNGKVIKSLTQVPWEYLPIAEKKGYVKLPFAANCVATLNTWTNSFVHTSFFYNNFVQYFAADFMWELFRPRKAGESLTLYNGKPAGYNLAYGDFRLTKYDEMKADFEQFIKTKTKQQFKINWLSKDDVEGYILS